MCRYRRVEPSGMRMPAMKPTSPREATLMMPRALEGRFLGVADLAGIAVASNSGFDSGRRVEEAGRGGECHVWGMKLLGWIESALVIVGAAAREGKDA